MSQFERYEQDLVELIKSTKIKLADKVPIADKDEKKILIRQINKELDDMNSLMADMEYEIGKFGPNSRTSVTNKLKKYKLDIEIIQKDLKKATSASVNPNYQSTGSTSQDANDPQRRQVLQIHSSLMNAGNSLARSTQVAIETEQIGHEVLGELNDQGERLGRTYDTLVDTDVALSRSRRLLNKLSRGVLYNKLLLFIIIVLELCALGGIIYWKFFS